MVYPVRVLKSKARTKQKPAFSCLGSAERLAAAQQRGRYAKFAVGRLAFLLTALWLAGCSVANFDIPGASGDPAAYADRHPFYAEYCALSQIKKKPGFGADIRGQIGGHAVFFLNGACRIAGVAYPVLQVCDGVGGRPPDGVGLSMNAHFLNAKWVAVPGREFFFHGNLPPDAPVTRDTYDRVQREAKRLRIYEGVVFHPWVFATVPPGWSPEDTKYEVSVATDYAISLGRGRFCARVPVSRAQMAAMVAFLNEQNAPYRSGAQQFEWSVFTDNCIHLAHNALAAAGFWEPWRIHRPLLVSVFDFPTPKNEFVNLMRRANDLRLLDPARAFRDPAARRSLSEFGRLPVEPGVLAEARGPQRPNAVYDTDLKLIFYDAPPFGPYQGWFDAIFSDSGDLDIEQNEAAFAAAYRDAEAARRPLGWWQERTPFAEDPAFPAFYDKFYRSVAEGRMGLRATGRKPAAMLY